MTVRDWEEATEIAGSLLIKSGVALPEYIVAMKRVLKEMGPYAVIAPGIVLLHARPEDGVLKPGLALVTLSTPVNFGHTENDPVDLVFALAATDKTSHLQGLQELAQLLSDGEVLKGLRSAQTDEELLKIVHSS
jgi:PTS system ascorbate-specific IIA component